MSFTKPIVPALALVAVLTAALPLTARSTRRPPTSETPLGEHMEGLKTHLKGAAMALQNPDDRDAALVHIAELQRLVLLSKLEAPSNLNEVPEEERAEHRASFRRDLALVLREFVEMEIHVLDGETEKAFARVIDPLYPMRETAHEKYQPGDG